MTPLASQSRCIANRNGGAYDAEPLIRHLSRGQSLSDLEVDRLRTLPGGAFHAAGKHLSSPDEIDAQPRFVVGGWAYRARFLPNGRRQIFSFVMPGDEIDVWAPSMGCTTVVGIGLLTVDAASLLADVQSGNPTLSRLAEAFRHGAQEDRAQMLENIVRLGQLDSRERTASLLLEWYYRVSAVGLVGPEGCPAPFNARELADALGITTVHLSRTLQGLRRDQLIEFDHGWLHCLDLPRLIAIAHFHVRDLNCEEKPRTALLN